jgi:hypothetical protein
MDKLGIDNQAAKQIAEVLVPVVISKLVNRTNDPNDNSFDINSIFSSLTDGRSSGMDMSSLLGQHQGNQNGEFGSIFNMLSGK